jgi:hypothetical protein
MSAAAWTVQMWSDRSAVSSSLDAACAEVGAELVFRAGLPRAASSPAAPALLAAVLPAGERSLPPELVRELDANAELSLLLLCEEALVRPTLAIQQGRIVLLEPPLTASRIEARLRLLMTARCSESAGSSKSMLASPVASTSVPCERHRTADYWFAVFMGAATERSRALTWRTHAQSGLSWALSEAGLDAAPDRVRPASREAGAEDVELERGLRAVLGLDGALVQLEPNARQWRFLLPDDGCQLRVFSHQRLPRAWDAGRALARCNSRFFRLVAAPGDVVCLMTESSLELTPTLERSALDGGGPALFQALVNQCSLSRSELAAGVVVEVM